MNTSVRHPALGRLSDTVAFTRDPRLTLARLRRTAGPLFELWSPIAGSMTVVGSPELAHEVLRAPSGAYLAGAGNRRMLPLLPADTVLTLDGDAHRRRRRLLAPLLHGRALDALAPAVREITAREVDRWPLGVPHTVLPGLRRITLQIAARAVLGIDDPIVARRLQHHLERALRPYPLLAAHAALARLGRGSPQAARARGRREFARALAALLAELGGSTAPLGADETFALLLAGYETVATALAWALDELARAPHVADTIAAESAGVADAPGGCPWLDATIHEVLRLHPPLVDIVRQPSQPVALAGRRLEPETLLLIPPPLIHRQAAARDGDRFQPARFVGRRPDPCTWLPFGGGPRRCLGAALARLELREVLAQLVARFELRPAHATRARTRLHGTALVPRGGVPLVLEARRREP